MDHGKASGRQDQELSGNLRLRKAAPADTGALTALAMRSKAHWGYDEAFMEACRDELTITEDGMRLGETWLAEDDGGRIVGFFDLRAEDGVAELYDLFVDPDAMGLGAGRLLWNKLEGVAGAMGVNTIGIDADPHAVAFYEHMGAGVVGESPSVSIAGRMLPRLTKKILSQDAGEGD